jgi:hypothetical protein
MDDVLSNKLRLMPFEKVNAMLSPAVVAPIITSVFLF